MDNTLEPLTVVDTKVPPTKSSNSDEEAVAHVEDDSGNDKTLAGPIELDKV